MIDQEARRRLLDAQNQADAAAASRDLARESVHRLQQEVSIAATIASEGIRGLPGPSEEAGVGTPGPGSESPTTLPPRQYRARCSPHIPRHRPAMGSQADQRRCH